MHMKKATNITLATLATLLLASSCIKEADPYEIATEDRSYRPVPQAMQRMAKLGILPCRPSISPRNP